MSERRYKIKAGKITGAQCGQQITIMQALAVLIAEAKSRNAEFERLSKRADRQAERKKEKMARIFVDKIYQPAFCADCGAYFDTLFPPHSVVYDIHRPNGRTRCFTCSRARRLKNHGGGPRRRCIQYGVPYEVISPGVIFTRDNNLCQLCGKPVKRDADYLDPEAAELDHIWPLSLVIDGEKSPGHVLDNLQTTHKRCNTLKGNKLSENCRLKLPR
jgi:hypothetical protein